MSCAPFQSLVGGVLLHIGIAAVGLALRRCGHSARWEICPKSDAAGHAFRDALGPPDGRP